MSSSGSSATVPATTVTTVLARTLSSPARLGRGRLVCVDGPSGSGKSVLARAVAAEATARGARAQVVHTDDLLDGWGGLPGLADRLRTLVVEPLADGHPARYRRYDWEQGRVGEEQEVLAVDLLVLDGVGAGARALAPWRACLVWVAADDDALRLARALDRDGHEIRSELEVWHAAEREHFAREGLPGTADLRVDGWGRLAPGG